MVNCPYIDPNNVHQKTKKVPKYHTLPIHLRRLLKSFDASLLDFSEYHLHCYDFRRSLDVFLKINSFLTLNKINFPKI